VAEAYVRVTYKDMGLKKLKENLRELAKYRITVGYQGKDATHKLEADGPMTSVVARWQEFGTWRCDSTAKGGAIPARPFMRNAVKESGPKLAKSAAKAFAPVAEGKGDPVDAMGKVGETMAEAVLDKLNTTRQWAAPNAPSTIKKKGIGLPPLDAGHQRLHDDLSWAVREGHTIVKTGKPSGRQS